MAPVLGAAAQARPAGEGGSRRQRRLKRRASGARRRLLREETGRGVSGGRGGSRPRPGPRTGNKGARAPVGRTPARRACAPRPPSKSRAEAMTARERAPLAVNHPSPSPSPELPPAAWAQQAAASGSPVSRTRTGDCPAHCPAQAQPGPFLNSAPRAPPAQRLGGEMRGALQARRPNRVTWAGCPVKGGTPHQAASHPRWRRRRRRVL